MTQTYRNIAALKPLGKFLACLIGTAGLCLGGYAATVDSLVQSSEIPATYKWFLLKHVPGPRIIFESGSNSHHAIDTDKISAALGMTAINIADNGGYALEDKLTRLETYARAGDVIILPLEWTYYHREKLTDNYVDTLFTSNRDYYRSMPPLKRALRALSLPPEKVIAQVSQKKSRAVLETESPAQDLFVAALTQVSGHKSQAVSSGAGLGVDEQSCDDYVLGKAPQRQSLSLGANIKPALARLRKLKSRGVDIYFAWPVLAGDSCMSDPAYVTGFRTDIERAVNAADFAFLGTPSQSLYGEDVRDDSPYHIITKGTDAHTEQMIGFLKTKGYGSNGSALDIKTFARHRLLELELAQAAPLTQPPFPLDETIAMDNVETRALIDFTAGWWGFESYGRWMRDNRAMFRVTLPSELSQTATLKIQGITKSGRPERVNVSINGELITSGIFGENAPLLVPVASLPKGNPLSIFLSLPEAGQPQSPLERGENEDARSMTLHLQNIELTAQMPTPTPEVIKTDVVKPATVKQINRSPVPISGPVLTGEYCAIYGNTMPEEFTQGWWAQEATGRWMQGQTAEIKLALPLGIKSASRRYRLKLTGDIFMDEAKSLSLNIDGQDIGAFTPASDGTISAEFSSPKTVGLINVQIKLSGKAPLSPKLLGLSQDDRTLTYFLKSAALAAI